LGRLKTIMPGALGLPAWDLPEAGPAVRRVQVETAQLNVMGCRLVGCEHQKVHQPQIEQRLVAASGNLFRHDKLGRRWVYLRNL